MAIRVFEKDESGLVRSTILPARQSAKRRGHSSQAIYRISTERIQTLAVSKALSKLFLPDGYPQSVTSGVSVAMALPCPLLNANFVTYRCNLLLGTPLDYAHYQVYNCLQAFCSAVAGLIASRAILEGAGVGDASASATNALLVTVLQDVCSRFTTIIGAYFIGTSLFPEAKTYRLAADILNDTAITLDALSPLLNSVRLPFGVPLPFPGSIRVAALCLSGSLRSLCGIAAGGSKTALSAHFASPVTGTCDLGDLNAKDSSRETVISLVGMLIGTVMIPYLTTRWSTYTVLFVLLASHLWANYVAVRGVTLRTLNRQRTGIAWDAYRQTEGRTLSPAEVSTAERVFEVPGTLRGGGRVLGRCVVGSSLSVVLNDPIPAEVLAMFSDERYILWFDPRNLHNVAPPEGNKKLRGGFLRLHVFLKEGHRPVDELKAWVHAVEVARLWSEPVLDDGSCVVCSAYLAVQERFTTFVGRMREGGWSVEEGGIAIMTGMPKSVVVSVSAVDGELYVPVEERKDE